MILTMLLFVFFIMVFELECVSPIATLQEQLILAGSVLYTNRGLVEVIGFTSTEVTD